MHLSLYILSIFLMSIITEVYLWITPKRYSFRKIFTTSRSYKITNKVSAVLFSTESQTSEFYNWPVAKFCKARDWDSVKEFWYQCISNERKLPNFVEGLESSQYRITNLTAIEEIGKSSEFQVNSSLYQSRATYALRIGYVGTAFNGYQSQNNRTYLTVEDDIDEALEIKSHVAGRTDRNVSAISQIVCFVSKKILKTTEILSKFQSVKSYQLKKLMVYECVRVPRKFNARASATWRRYIYLFPLNASSNYRNGFDVDVDYLNTLLEKLVQKNLPYNNFARGEQRNLGDGMQDNCILFHALASIVNITDSKFAISFELVGNRFLRNMVRTIVATSIRESLLSLDQRNDFKLLELCQGGKRNDTEYPFPGMGLCLAGVGYDLVDLSIYKDMKKTRYAELGLTK